MSYTITSGYLFIVLLVVTACKIRSEDETSTRSVVKASDVLDNKSRYFTKEDECLVEIDETLKKNSTSQVLSAELCLPRSRVSFLLPVPSKGTRSEKVASHLKLAILFDASVSLVEQDSKRARFNALKEYLMAIFAKKKEGQISSAEINIYPFRYCNKGVHSLELRPNTTRDNFAKAVDTLIGTKDVGNKGINIVDNTDLDNLRAYGAVGSTNYLNSFAKAKTFLKQQTAVALKVNKDTIELKQMLIFSDGLPFTFNDGFRDTIDTDGDDCRLSRVTNWTLGEWQNNLFVKGSSDNYLVADSLKGCVKADLFHPQDSCQRPKSTDKGIKLPQAWDDPLNHVLGMIQHSYVIKKEKDNFSIYSVHLNNCKKKNTSTKFDEDFLCQKISEDFFRSFSDGFVAVGDAADLKDKLTKQTLQSQFELDYTRGVAKLTGGMVVDNKLTFYEDKRSESSIVKIDGNLVTKSNGKGQTTRVVETFDYQDHDNNTLIASLQTKGSRINHYYRLAYNFRFDDNCLGQGDKHREQVSNRNDNVEAIDVYGWQEEEYRAWCVLPVVNDGFDFEEEETDPPPPPPVVTCANYEGSKTICGKGMKWVDANTGTPPDACCGQIAQVPDSPDQRPDQVPPPDGGGKIVIDVPPNTDDGGGKVSTCADFRGTKECAKGGTWVDTKTGTPPEGCCVEDSDSEAREPERAPPMEVKSAILQIDALDW